MGDQSREALWADWMRSALLGDAAAYQRFLGDVAPHLRASARRGCHRYGLPLADAKDVVQEVLLAVHLKRGSWDINRPIGPWLSVILRHKLIDQMRRRGRAVSVPIDDIAELIGTEENGEAEDLRDAERLVGRLKDSQQEIVRSISLEGKDVRETAERLNMSEGAVRVSLHRALKALAGLYRASLDARGEQ